MDNQDQKSDFAVRSFLLIEDFEAMRGILRDLLIRCGAKKIETSINAKDALNTLRRSRCDVVICDYHLGDGKNGQQLLEEARQEALIDSSTLWIMVTAEKTFSMVIGAVEHQPDDYLIKPITEATLFTRLTRLMARKKDLSEITNALYKKEYTRALGLCEKRLSQDIGSPLETQKILADVYHHLGRFDDEKQLYDSILARRDIAWARLGKAKLLFMQNKYKRAFSVLEHLIVDNPNYLDAYDWIARIHIMLGAPEEAEHVLNQALLRSPNSSARQTAMGDAAFFCQHFDMAEKAYLRAIRISSQARLKQPNAYIGLARIYCGQEKYKEALSILEQLIDEVGGDDIEIIALGEKIKIFSAAGQTEHAKMATNRLQSMVLRGVKRLTPETLLDLSEILMIMGDIKTAQELLLFVLRNNHENDNLAARAQEIYSRVGLCEQGRDLIGQTRRDALNVMNEGVRLAMQGNLDEALERLSDARELMPRNPRLLLNYAWIIVTKLQKEGWRHDLESEARRVIAIARQLSPGERRCGELLAQLEVIE